jgi:tetratricopeptide (TPR) repeat protein
MFIKFKYNIFIIKTDLILKKKIKMIPFHQIPLSAIILYRMALEVSVRGNHELALKHLSNAVVLAPQFTLAICEMGYCYEKLGRYLEAIAKFDTVLKINPSHREAEINKNRIQEKLGNKK